MVSMDRAKVSNSPMFIFYLKLVFVQYLKKTYLIGILFGHHSSGIILLPSNFSALRRVKFYYSKHLPSIQNRQTKYRKYEL